MTEIDKHKKRLSRDVFIFVFWSIFLLEAAYFFFEEIGKFNCLFMAFAAGVSFTFGGHVFHFWYSIRKA
jgi:hypothetical protein